MISLPKITAAMHRVAKGLTSDRPDLAGRSIELGTRAAAMLLARRNRHTTKAIGRHFNVDARKVRHIAIRAERAMRGERHHFKADIGAIVAAIEAEIVAGRVPPAHDPDGTADATIVNPLVEEARRLRRQGWPYTLIAKRLDIPEPVSARLCGVELYR